MKFAPEIKESRDGDGPEGTIDELVEERLGGDGADVGGFAEAPGEKGIPKGDLEALVAPVNGEGAALAPCVARARRRHRFQIKQRDESAEDAGGEDVEGGADDGAEIGEAGEGGLGGAVKIVAEHDGEREGLQDEAGDEVGAGAAEAGFPRGFFVDGDYDGHKSRRLRAGREAGEREVGAVFGPATRVSWRR